MEILIPKLNFLGFKKDKPYVLLSLKDLPIIGNNKDEIVSEVRKLLRDEYGIIVDDIPAVIIYSNKVKVKAKIEDIDYAYILP